MLLKLGSSGTQCVAIVTFSRTFLQKIQHFCYKLAEIYSLRHRKCGVRGFIHELFVSKTRTSEVRASEGF